MLENLFLKEEEETNFLYIFALSAIITIIALMLTNYVIKFQRGLLTVFIISLASAYPIIRFLREEAREEEYIAGKKNEEFLLKRHAKEIGMYLSFFLGIVAVISVAYFMLPPEFFSIQLDTITSITGRATRGGMFSQIVTNNLRVFSMTFLLSFLVSAGMLFILVWNASVFGVFLADRAQSIASVPAYALAYLPHGLIEVGAYIVAGLAGLLISTHFEDIKDEDSEVTYTILEDVTFMIALGIGLIFLGALVEVYV